MAFLLCRKLIINSTRNQLKCVHLRTISNQNKKFTNSTTLDDELEKPIEFLKSEASKLKAEDIRRGAPVIGPWYQEYVVGISLIVFMLYFFVLREENDVDLEFDKSLYSRIQGLEEKNLEIVLQYNKENNLPTADIEAKLKELQSKRN